MKKIFSIVFAIVVLVAACNKPKATVEQPIMQSSADSMSYVMGMNIARNLQGIDSMLNIDMVAEGMLLPTNRVFKAQ